jgi:RimJ/RimL family protein N-acetyltransferase
LLEQLFSKRQAKLVLAFTDSRNLASKKLLGSLGFLNQPDKNWVEEFKGETVTVETYELRSPSAL